MVSGGHTTVFLTSHVLEIVERLCSDVGIIADGKLVASGRLVDLQIDEQGRPRSLEQLFVALVGGDRATGAELSWLGA
jgi:ABC-2 type transport system ATP-binding protein